ncbi:MBL fold metallo-hydrolase [Amycolatopsis rubida]|uniref:Glyoxylase, beta-lactamase superfamily II n=1 Tax=Amycolatopsis rubida TaxID=112413 RepID=A0A1I6ARN8_9PSEU|nr:MULTISPECIES: MBL fold metallo-hydrolase [Amycolatopsis]MYW93161.1 MBL fold metallo-hydrolase [Amycolatopsis rubida]NEC58148.1 MBL fold metallo-hydrolase [Amycolatopsis rubida]OAP24398.1 putative quorum-quenching lactonase YtnP [Amycolatopsis sp. M39]SFQ71267.1 Glyoxylase, beta-lactamase superfamily II [Amycolatopsis rubida]
MKIGAVDIVPILDGIARLPLAGTVVHARGARWECRHQPLDAEGRIRMDVGSFLVRLGDRTVLVDAGTGPGFEHDGFATGGLLGNLRRAGVAPEEVTDVVFTHLHVDHVGWSSVRGEAVFPRAAFRMHAADWAHFTTGETADPAVRATFAPILGQVETFDGEIELVPGLVARPAPGHTPGSTVFVVSDAGERALLLGDVLHTVSELTDPEWEGMFDVDRPAATAMRQRIAAELEASGDVFAPAHFPGLAFGRLVTAAGIRRFAWA